MSKIAKAYLVDDSDIDNMLHSIICEKSGAVEQVVANTDAEDAVKKFMTTTPLQEGEFIFLDINMPKMNGYEFLEKLSEYAPVHELPPFVVMVSTSSNPKDEAKSRAFPIVLDYMTKPLTAEALLKLSTVAAERLKAKAA